MAANWGLAEYRFLRVFCLEPPKWGPNQADNCVSMVTKGLMSLNDGRKFLKRAENYSIIYLGLTCAGLQFVPPSVLVPLKGRDTKNKNHWHAIDTCENTRKKNKKNQKISFWFGIDTHRIQLIGVRLRKCTVMCEIISDF